MDKSFLRSRIRLTIFTLLFAVGGLQLAGLQGCATPPKPQPLTISEQINVDTTKAQALFLAFQKRAVFVKSEEVEKYLTAIARKLATVQDGFEVKKVIVKIHRDDDPEMKRFFSFPGTTISVPVGFLKTVDYENELAGALAFELGNVINRHLAKKVEEDAHPVLWGTGSVFDLERPERVQSIDVGERLLYYTGYDLRGMPSFFRRYEPKFKVSTNLGSSSNQKEVDFNWKESQRAKSTYLPSSNPTVRSGEFIKMKKEMKHL
jgi:predicted Zn-dependent protease